MPGIQLAADELSRLVAARPKETADVLHQLQHPIRSEEDLLDLLGRTTHLAVELIDGADWAGVTAQFGADPFTASRTHERVQSVDDVQYALDDGPCLRALRQSEVVAMSATMVHQEFPELFSVAQRHDVGSFLAAPMSANGESIGALNLYSADEAAFESADQGFMTLLVGCASRGLSEYALVHSTEILEAQLHQAILHRAPIEQAKGILMAVRQIGPDDAFTVLREESMRRNIKLRDLAVDFVADTAGQAETASTQERATNGR